MGEFDENTRKGPGLIKFDFEEDYKFEGVYEQNKKNGFGRFSSHQGQTEGMFTDGVLEGYGRNVTSEGLFYEGYFQEGKKEGYGLEVQPNSDVFIGEFRRDKKEGVGLYLFAKGGYYYGFFRNNEKSGLGVLYSRFNYAYYFGEFAADRKEGRGVEVFKDRSVFNGFYESNKRSGPGIMEYSNKSTYVGEWKNGVRSGKGRCEAGKLVTSGNWEFDRIKVACAVDLDELMQPLYDSKPPANIESHLKHMSYIFTKKLLPDLNLNTMLRPPLLDSLKLRAAQGLIRGHILRKISNILNNSVVLNEVSDGIYKAFIQVPDHQKVFAPIGDRVDFKFQSGEYKIRWIGINFDDKKKPSFQLDHMIISSKPAKLT